MRRASILAFSVAGAVFAASTAYANSGQSASHCVDVYSENAEYGDSVYFNMTNMCSGPVFVLYCGDVVGSNSVCQGGPNSVFYSHSKELRPGSTSQAAILPNGVFYWAACDGSMGFGNDGHFEDYSDGSYVCLPR